jgi:subtilase family serine protease
MYGLPGVYAKGITGKGQTIVLIDAYGSPTIASDLATFSANYGLAQPSFTGLRVYRPAPVTGSNTSWAEETTLDTEWAHAIAPGANIAIVEAVGQKDSELQTALDYAVRHKLGTIISCSFGGPESEATPATLNKWNQILEMAAAQGIAVQIASGDSGDYAAELGYTDVSAPADSPYATAVGGTSMAYLPDNSTLVQTGWGTNVTALEVGGKLLDPTKNSAFYYGSGGGSSKFFAKPAYQAQLAGTKRLLPDVSALADPFTGAEVLYTQRGQPEYFVVGGTSLAAPLFSAMYALLAQSTGETLGQAAPYVAAGSPLLVDVTAPSTADNPTGELTTSAGTTRYSTTDLSQPEAGTTGFAALLWKVSAEDLYNVSFGTDTSLEVTPGWDNVTGFGTLNFAP